MDRDSQGVQWLPLQTVAFVFAGLALSGRSPAGKGSHRVRTISVGDIQDGRIRNGSLSEVTVEHLAKVERYLLEPGDILVACRGTQPKVLLVPHDLAGAVLTSTLLGVRVRDTLLPEVLAAYLRSPRGQQALLSQTRSSTGQIALTTRDLAEIEVPVPPLETQHHIAKLVRLADAHYSAAIEAAELRRDVAYGYVMEAVTTGKAHWSAAVQEAVRSG